MIRLGSVKKWFIHEMEIQRACDEKWGPCNGLGSVQKYGGGWWGGRLMVGGNPGRKDAGTPDSVSFCILYFYLYFAATYYYICEWVCVVYGAGELHQLQVRTYARSPPTQKSPTLFVLKRCQSSDGICADAEGFVASCEGKPYPRRMESYMRIYHIMPHHDSGPRFLSRLQARRDVKIQEERASVRGCVETVNEHQKYVCNHIIRVYFWVTLWSLPGSVLHADLDGHICLVRPSASLAWMTNRTIASSTSARSCATLTQPALMPPDSEFELMQCGFMSVLYFRFSWFSLATDRPSDIKLSFLLSTRLEQACIRQWYRHKKWLIQFCFMW